MATFEPRNADQVGVVDIGIARLGLVHRVGFYAALALLFLRFSVLHETFHYFTGVDTYVLYLFGPVAVLSVLVTGGLRRILSDRTGKCWLAFVVWMAIDIPFSYWAGGSTLHLLSYIRTNLPMLLVVGGLARTWMDCRKLLFTIALAGVANLATARLLLHTADGRVSLAGEGVISNSNDLAAHLLVVLPFLLFYILRRQTSFLMRVVLAGIVGYGLFVILHTASRGALIALFCTCVFVLFRGSTRQRLTVVLAVPACFVLLIALLPGSTWKRLTSFTEGEQVTAEALQSSAERQYLLRQSVVYSVEHPLFGIGPGQFSSYEGATVSGAGMQASWHETHNSYTQVSAECGTPALLFYVAALFSTFSTLKQIRVRASRAHDSEVAAAAFAVSIALVAYSVATFFISFAYRFYLLTLSGLVIAMWLALRDQLPAANPWTPETAPWVKVQGASSSEQQSILT